MTHADACVAKTLVVTKNEQGLMGLAFPPGFAASKRLFVFYTAERRHLDSDGSTRRVLVN
jgi:hypothetical protein